MSYNVNFYNNFRGDSTFQNIVPQYAVPPPPLPPAYFVPPFVPQASDQEFVKTFELKALLEIKNPQVKICISKIKQQIQTLLLTVNNIKEMEKQMTNNIETLSEEEWGATTDQVERHKEEIKSIMAQINDTHLEVLKKLIAKRSAKRLRLKRKNLERKGEKQERIRELREKSRKIDEHLRKIQDDINKSKQKEEAKLQADMILKEVLRKKLDAKKWLTKLDALLKLRTARVNTARGRGENVPDSDVQTFNYNIEQLKDLWMKNKALYEKEECELRSKLQQNKEEEEDGAEATRAVLKNLENWREMMFGGTSGPQVDFGGDIGQFVAVRAQWDRYADSEGTSIPVGWVVPTRTSE